MNTALSGPRNVWSWSPACAMHIAIGAVMLWSGSARGQEGARITIDALKEHIAQQRAAIKSLLVSYELKLTYDPVLKEKGRLAGLTLEQTDTLAFLGDKRYCSVLAVGLDSSNNATSTERITVYTGKESRRRESKSLMIQKEKSAYSEINLYANGILWPMSDPEIESCKSDPHASFYLPYFLDSATWTVDGVLHPIAGSNCLLVQKSDGSRRVWFDPVRNYSLMRYEHAHPVPGTTKWVFDYSEHSQPIPGVYMPRQIRCAHHIADLMNGTPMGLLESNLRTTTLEANSVKESLFTLEPLPGEFIIDHIQRTMFTYSAPDDATLERAIEQAKGMRLQQPSRIRAYLIAGNVFALVILCGAVAGWIVRKHRS